MNAIPSGENAKNIQNCCQLQALHCRCKHTLQDDQAGPVQYSPNMCMYKEHTYIRMYTCGGASHLGMCTDHLCLGSGTGVWDWGLVPYMYMHTKWLAYVPCRSAMI